MQQLIDLENASQKTLALIHGVDVRTIRRWTEYGMPRLDGGGFDVPATIRWRTAQPIDSADRIYVPMADDED